MHSFSLLDNNDSQRDKLRQQINRYMSRAEELKNDTKIKVIKFISKKKIIRILQVNSLEQRKIAANSMGHGYDRVFAKCIDDELESVIVKDAYIIAHHQVFLQQITWTLKLSISWTDRSRRLRLWNSNRPVNLPIPVRLTGRFEFCNLRRDRPKLTDSTYAEKVSWRCSISFDSANFSW